ncbi:MULTISPECIES: hypothetical protein [Kamptonema]|uniref:hypothetical protein n=1 Tax=Kamptonema TaxID=1501433 RepID=UPI0001DAD0F4|nr:MULTISPECIES: hypothetical protein [Kamptonema]CBN58778.1 hypothetical protein OSCI_3880039 [Kamptonema sp. PCC 6506]
MTELIYPTVNLFLYDLRDGLGQNQEIALNCRQFWRKIDPEIDRQIQELVAVNPDREKVQLVKYEIAYSLDKKLKELGEKENSEAEFVQLYAKRFDEDEPGLDGYYFATQLGDTYALQVDSSGTYADYNSKRKNNIEQPIAQLQENKKIIISHLNHHPNSTELDSDKRGTMGQTWLVWGQLANNHDALSVAQECYQKLSPNSSWKLPEFKDPGQLLGANIYEYWHVPTNWGQKWEEFSQENYHLIICLFPASQTPDEIVKNRAEIQKIYFDLTRLLSYRHKVVWAYCQSRYLKAHLKQKSAEVKLMIDSVKQLPNQIKSQGLDLQELEENLTKALPLLSEYAIQLKSLEIQLRTIKSNLGNYKKRLKKLEEKPNTKLDLLEKFAAFAEEKYQEQIESDLASLNPDLTLIENLISTLRGIIDIEQTKSDRALNTTIFIASTGLAASGITATLVSTQVYSPQNKDNTMTLSSAIWWSIGITFWVIVSAIIFFSIPRFFRPRS